MAATAAQVPVEVYLRTSYEPDAEYVHGGLEQRPMGEYDHAAWQEALTLWFRQHAREWNIRFKPELRVQVASNTYRVPDVTVLDRNLPIEQIITHPPVAVFEILSPEDTMARMMQKLHDYAGMGIPQIWVIAPETKQYYSFQDGRLSSTSAFSEPERGISFEMTEVEKLLD